MAMKVASWAPLLNVYNGNVGMLRTSWKLSLNIRKGGHVDGGPDELQSQGLTSVLNGRGGQSST